MSGKDKYWQGTVFKLSVSRETRLKRSDLTQTKVVEEFKVK
jgi:hypothetical protein